MSLFFPPLAFVFGSVLGSFLNVVILRYIEAINASEEPNTERQPVLGSFRVGGRSHCPHCRRQLRWWELVPILSFIFLRGRCHRCQQAISTQYPIVELIMGALAMLLLTPLPMTLVELAVVALHVAIAALLVILFVIDLKTMLLPDIFVGLLLTAVVLEQALEFTTAMGGRIQYSLLGAGIGAGFLLFLWLITRGRGIGLGDVKLMVPLGLLFGPFATTTLLFIAYAAGGLYAIYLLLRKEATMKTALPFGPFLCGAALVLLVVPALSIRLLTLLFGYNPWL